MKKRREQQKTKKSWFSKLVEIVHANIVAVVIAAIAVFVGTYIYLLQAPTLNLQEMVEKASSEQQQAFETSSRATPAEKKSEDAEFEEFEALLQKKVSEPLKDGWFEVSNGTLPVYYLTENSQEELLNISSKNQPTFLIEEKILNSWPIFQWDFHQLAMKFNISLEDCRYQPSSVFILGQERDKGGMLGSPRDQPHLYTNISLLQFLQSTFDEKIFLYWTKELSDLEEAIGQDATKDHYYKSVSKKRKSKKTKDEKEDKEEKEQEKRKRKETGWEYFTIREKNLNLHPFQDDNNNNTNNKKDDLGLWHPMLWLSHPGVISQAHYDTQHNLFLQIQGVKKFYFFPPNVELYSYPNIHRSYRQSQIPFTLERSSLKEEIFPLINPLNSSNDNNKHIYEIIVKPGDILYIPPYWSHYVESLSLSLSLSVLSPSMIEAALSEIYWQKVPFGGDFSQSRYHRMKVVVLYFEKIFEFLNYLNLSSIVTFPSQQQQEESSGRNDSLISFAEKSRQDLHEFSQNLYFTRFYPLEYQQQQEKRTHERMNPKKFCEAELNTNSETEKLMSEEERMEIAKETAQRREQFHRLVANQTEGIDSVVMKIGFLFKDILDLKKKANTDENNINDNSNSSRSYYSDVSRIFLKDYMEQLVRWAVGPQYTSYFIQHCFSTNLEK
jgi:hypothetical protein